MPNKSYDEVQKNLGQTLKTMRKVAKVSQVDLGKLLTLHQTAVCRVEKGSQSLTPAELKLVSDFFGVGIDSIFNQEVDYDRVAKKFGVARKIPKDLVKNPTAKVREMLPLVQFLESNYGAVTAKKIYSKFGVDRTFFKSPDFEVNPTLNLGMLKFALTNELLTQKNFKKWIAQTRNHVSNGILHEIFKEQQSALALIQVYILNMHHYERNFNYTIEEFKPQSLTLAVAPAEHMQDYEYKGKVLETTLCDYKKQTLIDFPLYIGGKPIAMKEVDCHFKGDKRCIYTIAA